VSAQRERVSGFRRIESPTLYTLGAIFTGALTYLVATLLLSFVPEQVRVGVAVAVLAVSLLWHAAGSSHMKFAQHSRQSNRGWAFNRRRGRLYFGALMGIGIATHMTTPLVYASILLAASKGPSWALTAGVGFGLGRSVPAIAAVFLGRRVRTPATVAITLLGHEPAARVLGAGIALVGLVSALLL
jgi:cytochrome c biogenesis protein CcdA